MFSETVPTGHSRPQIALHWQAFALIVLPARLHVLEALHLQVARFVRRDGILARMRRAEG
ncbi:hypothetical protein [Celeribacter neptunius]|uniref:Uncharacterized protein n=1 Tax=Celeribacter neptunius TaxID=588602 RepID=A0A1I3RA59_9RHOB|nr:hypothetical protein [Celeribacter neptunius]SFJ42066.1 hypothetical protein SAMN04487991_2105 [Celeribacter neptunius]